MKTTSVLLICLLVFAVVYGLGATQLWHFEEDEDLEYCSKTVLVGDRWPHSPNITLLGDRWPHSPNITLLGDRWPHSPNTTFV